MGDVTPVIKPAPLSECTCPPGGPDSIRHDQGCPCRVDRTPASEHGLPVERALGEKHAYCDGLVAGLALAASYVKVTYGDDLGIGAYGDAAVAAIRTTITAHV